MFGRTLVYALYNMSILSKITPIESELHSEIHQAVVKATGTSASKRVPGTQVHWIIVAIGSSDYMVSNKDNKSCQRGDTISVTAYENKDGDTWLQY